ncbi:glycosyltransferase [Leucobacter sp. HY1910]
MYDNNSADRTAEVAAAAGAIVRREERRGKGNVVRRAFADIDADVYLLIDGDDTYEAAMAPAMIEKLLSGPYDHVLGCRVDDPTQTAYRVGHAQGNRMFNSLVGWLFGERVTDMLSGYRVFSRRFVKSFPALSAGFEIETELTVHSMALRVPQCEMPVGFKDRPEGSESKLNTFSDGFKILWLIARLFSHERPFAFHGLIATISMVLALIFGLPVIAEYLETGLVPRMPTVVLAAALAIISAFVATTGAIIAAVLKSRREAARLAYLRFRPATRA